MRRTKQIHAWGERKYEGPSQEGLEIKGHQNVGNSPFCEHHMRNMAKLTHRPMLPASEQNSAMCFAQGQQLNVHSEVLAPMFI